MQLQRVPFRNSSRMFTIFSCMLGWRHCSGTWGISNRSYFGRAPPRSVFGSEPVLLVLYSLILNTLPRKNDKINNSYYLPCPHVFCTGLIKREPSRAFLYKIICILQSNLAGIDILLCSPSFSLFWQWGFPIGKYGSCKEKQCAFAESIPSSIELALLSYGLSKFLNGGSGCVLIPCECTNTLPYRTPIATQVNSILNLGKCIRIGAWVFSSALFNTFFNLNTLPSHILVGMKLFSGSMKDLSSIW